MRLSYLIKKDFLHFKKNLLSPSCWAIIINPSFHAVILFRFSSWLYNHKLKIIPKLIWFINRIVYSVDIDYRATIGPGFNLVHGLGVVIGHEVVIGENVRIYQNVTIGGNNGKTTESKGRLISQPIIEDNVIIGANSLILGPVNIKSNSIIGVGAIVLEDVEQETIYYCKVNPVKRRKMSVVEL
ncbi:MAG: serine O-acetyltransferase [Deltaproteobacteria bacterium]